MRKHHEQSLVTGRMWTARRVVPGFLNVDGDWGLRDPHTRSVGTGLAGEAEDMGGAHGTGKVTGKVLARETQKSPKKRWK